MRDAATIAKYYIALWNETDPKRRAEVLADEWEENASYVDPVMRGAGEGRSTASSPASMLGSLTTVSG